MRATPPQEPALRELRPAIERLEALPMRPCSARQVLAIFLDDDPASPDHPATLPTSTATDPAWALATSRAVPGSVDPLATLAGHRWWPEATSHGSVAEALDRLWRHSTAVAFAARRLAKEAGDPDPEAVVRAGLLHNLGIWALAAVSPGRLVEWFGVSDPSARRSLEIRWLGTEASNLGRLLALRWASEPLVADSSWLHADLGAGLGRCSSQPDRLGLIQQAYATASTTPWAPGAELARDGGPIDPRVRILTAEVQARCGVAFVAPDAPAREERLTRDNARLRASEARSAADRASKDRFLRAFEESSPNEAPGAWADRAALAWCGEPGVGAARVVWGGADLENEAKELEPRSPSIILPLGDPSNPIAEVKLWEVGEAPESNATLAILGTWDTWARQVDERIQLQKLLDEVISTHRSRVALEEPALRQRTIEALAEFAAGAGHELNNPLAVIVGRAQLLLAREDEPEAVRSLRAIIAQAQRAARILRDLMFVARPPEPRPRPCQPEEVVRACLRDLQSEADARGVRIVAESREPGLRVWTDPDPLRQLADILTHNALEASSSGGLVQFTTGGDSRALRWSVHDNGRGIGPAEGTHLFDPFYCGRQAGRGLGLGLPRASRIVDQVGGELKWQSIPGVGTTFLVTLPVAEIPAIPEEEKPGGPRSDRALPLR